MVLLVASDSDSGSDSNDDGNSKIHIVFDTDDDDGKYIKLRIN